MNAPMKIYVPVMDGKPLSSWHYSTSPYAPEKDVEYIRADIHEAQIDALKAENAEAKGQIEWMDKENNRIKAENNILKTHLTRVIGEHIVPDYCYATGPSTGDDIADLVVCPSCAALDYLASKEKK